METPVIESLNDLSKNDLIRAIAHLTDGNSEWYDIQERTGLLEESSRTLSHINRLCIRFCIENGWDFGRGCLLEKE